MINMYVEYMMYMYVCIMGPADVEVLPHTNTERGDTVAAERSI